MSDKLLAGSPSRLASRDLSGLASPDLDRIQSSLTRRVHADPEGLEKGLA